MGWLFLIAGGAMALTPGIIDPMNVPINGLTLLGIITMFVGVMIEVRK